MAIVALSITKDSSTDVAMGAPLSIRPLNRSFQEGAVEVEPLLTQRIFDTGLGQYVTYRKVEIDLTPAPGETTPPSTSLYDAATHEVL